MLLWPGYVTAIPLYLLLPSNILPHFAQRVGSLCFYEIFFLVPKWTWKNIPNQGFLMVLCCLDACRPHYVSSHANIFKVLNYESCRHFVSCLSSFFWLLLCWVKQAAFLHIFKENTEYLSSASSLAHSYVSGSTRLTILTSCLIWAGVFYRLFTGLFGVYKDLGEEYAVL